MTAGEQLGLELRADCSRCSGLCCVAPPFAASEDFAFDKGAGEACRHLAGSFRCDIHAELRLRGFPGCAAYDCFGAGQKVSQVTFGGQDWRAAPESAASMFECFFVMRRLHEKLWSLTQASALELPERLRGDLGRAEAELRAETLGPAEAVRRADALGWARRVDALLLRVASQLALVGADRQIDRRGADLVGAELAGIVLVGARLGRARLDRADLRGADLRRADLTGATLRAARLAGADLRGADLRDADLGAADLRGANLEGAEVGGADLSGADLSYLDTPAVVDPGPELVD